jgi:hypothetical protein
VTAAGGLRRFTVPATAPAGAPAVTVPAHRPVERCEMCGAELGDRHGHVVALDDRALRCACRPCYLLFTPSGAGGGRLRAVPDRYVADPAHPLADADWDLLGIPVTTVFFFANSDTDRVVACYPSPAGATECLLDLDGWAQLRRAYPLLRIPLADVEAVFVTRTGGLLEAFLVPVDACYALVGDVRLRWHGLDGGDAVRRVITGFVDDLRARCRSVRPGEV